jgi:hypothetical protein
MQPLQYLPLIGNATSVYSGLSKTIEQTVFLDVLDLQKNDNNFCVFLFVWPNSVINGSAFKSNTAHVDTVLLHLDIRVPSVMILPNISVSSVNCFLARDRYSVSSLNERLPHRMKPEPLRGSIVPGMWDSREEMSLRQGNTGT